VEVTYRLSARRFREIQRVVDIIFGLNVSGMGLQCLGACIAWTFTPCLPPFGVVGA
jgi:hypothetical protein